MDAALQKQTISTFRVPPEDTNSKVLWNTVTQTMLSNLDHIMLIHQCENLKQKPSGCFYLEKLNYKYILFLTNLAMSMHSAPLLC
jgi:hypothetical protein